MYQHVNKERRCVYSTSTTLRYPEFLTRVSAAEFDGRVADVGDAFAVFFVAHVDAVGVSITAPAQRNTQTVHPTLKLICVTATGGTGR